MKAIPLYLASAFFVLTGCSGQQEHAKQESPIQAPSSLAKTYANSFSIGAAVSKKQIIGDEPAAMAVVKQHFNSLVAENEMKWEKLEPLEGQFDFSVSDQLIEFAQTHNMEMIGHTLLWHSQTPEWVFKNENNEPASKAVLLARLKRHIDQVAGRYKGQTHGWDVVNEALNDDGTWRESPWYQILGEDYIIKAFEYAAQADPNAELYYNDYNLFKPEKRAGAIKIVKMLQDKGLRIDGVGIQGHYGINYPDLTELENSIKAFAALGVKVMITELDISVLPFPEEENQGADVSIDLALQDKLNPYANGLDAEMEQKLSANYTALFKIFLRHQDDISRITFWGVNDAQTWRNDWPMKGRADYPLLFDRNNKAKPVLNELIELKTSQ